MRLRYIALAATVLVATPLIAQQASQLPGQKDATRVTGGTYTADAGHTLIGWRVDHLGFNDYFGIFGSATGTLVIDPKNPSAAKVDITIPVSKITTANAALTGHLLKAPAEGAKPDFFGPTPADARFVSTSVVVDSDGDEAKVTGNLTLNGVTKPVTLDVEFKGAGANPMSKVETVGFEAETTIKRSDFGIAYGIPFVSDEVELDITVAFEKK
jgi:polyisoprenoid-binding protein YceI